DLLGVAFHHGVAQGNLAVAAHDDFAVAAYGNDGGQGNISTLRGRWPEGERIGGWFDGASSGVRRTSQAFAPLSLWGRLDAGRRSGVSAAVAVAALSAGINPAPQSAWRQRRSPGGAGCMPASAPQFTLRCCGSRLLKPLLVSTCWALPICSRLPNGPTSTRCQVRSPTVPDSSRAICPSRVICARTLSACSRVGKEPACRKNWLLPGAAAEATTGGGGGGTLPCRAISARW